MLNGHMFFDAVKNKLDAVAVSQKEAILQEAAMMSECMMDDGVVQIYGSSHNAAFTMELFYRAGGLVPFHKLVDEDLVYNKVISHTELTDPNYENRLYLAEKLIGMYEIHDNDMALLVSTAGNQALIIELAKIFKSQGRKLIVVTSKAQSAKNTSKHPDGKMLEDYADLVIDNCADVIDTVLPLDEKVKVNQFASITGNVIAQMLTGEIYHNFEKAGKECPVLLSANLAGSDVHNNKLCEKYGKRVRG